MKNQDFPFPALFAMGFFPALLLAYAMFNPEGMSYFQSVLKPAWAILSSNKPEGWKQFNSIQAFVGVCLLIGIVFYSKQVVNFVGSTGLFLSIAFFGTFYWMLIEQKLLPSERLSAHIILILVSLFLGMSVAWPRRAKPEEPKDEPPKGGPSQTDEELVSSLRKHVEKGS